MNADMFPDTGYAGMMRMDRNELRRTGTSLKPTLQVGKSGFDDSITRELDSQLEKRELVKMKVLRSMGPASGWRKDLEEMVRSLKAELVEVRGGTVLVHRKKGTSRGKVRMAREQSGSSPKGK